MKQDTNKIKRDINHFHKGNSQQNAKIKDNIIYCNCCGNIIDDVRFPKKDYLKVEKAWGYFSEKDLEIHEFYLCEECYNNIISKFKVPPSIKNNNEPI